MQAIRKKMLKEKKHCDLAQSKNDALQMRTKVDAKGMRCS